MSFITLYQAYELHFLLNHKHILPYINEIQVNVTVYLSDSEFPHTLYYQ